MMDKIEIVSKEREAILQTFAEVYLKRNGKPESSIMFSKSEDKYGTLNEEQSLLLHFYLSEEYEKMGVSLSDCIKKSGEEVVPGKLSNYELRELVRRADDMILFLDTMMDRKKRLYNK